MYYASRAGQAMIRGIVIFAAFWSFVAMPALCEGGLLLHACSQHDSQGCGHESDCHDDPCAKFIAHRGSSGARGDLPDWVQQPIASPEPIAATVLEVAGQFNSPLDRILAPTPAPHVTLPLLI